MDGLLRNYSSHSSHLRWKESEMKVLMYVVGKSGDSDGQPNLRYGAAGRNRV